MLRQTCEAIFENGVFRLLSPLDIAIPEGQQVRLIVEIGETPEDVLELATHVYDGLSEQQIDEVEQIILNRRDFFGERAAV